MVGGCYQKREEGAGPVLLRKGGMDGGPIPPPNNKEHAMAKKPSLPYLRIDPGKDELEFVGYWKIAKMLVMAVESTFKQYG